MAESIVTLRVEARNAISSLNKTSQATKKLSTSAKGATASLTAASTAAKGLGASLAATLGPLITVGAAVATVSNAIGTFTARQRDVEILRQGLVNLGEGTLALNNLQEAANKLGNQTLFNQEEFTRGFNLLTSFRNIGVDAYERVAQAAADIAQVNQVDVSTSFMQLAKALQDPERNLSNLNRSGIAFTKTQTEVIKELMKTNKTAEAHAMILSIVEESYNKLSQAASEGLAGDLDALGETFRDFSETLGKALEPALIAGVKGLTSLIKASEDLIKSPLGQTALIFTGVAFAVKGVVAANVLLKASLTVLTAKFAATNAGAIALAKAQATASLSTKALAIATGGLSLALSALPLVAIAGGFAFLTAAIIKAINKQKEFNKLLEEGNSSDLQAKIDEVTKKINKLKVAKAKADEQPFLIFHADQQIQLNSLNNDLDKLKEKLVIAQGIELFRDFEKAKKALQATNEKLKENVERSKIATEEGRKQFDLEQKRKELTEKYGEELANQLIDIEKSNQSLKKQEDQIKKNQEATKALKDKFMEIGKGIEDGIVSNLTDAVMGTKTLAQAAISVLNDLKRKLIEVAIERAVAGIGDFIGGALSSVFTRGKNTTTNNAVRAGSRSIGRRANGGPVSASGAFLVGERGPELLQMGSRGGFVTPNSKLGGTTNIVNVSVDASGSSVSGSNQDAQALGNVIGAAIRAELIKEKRAGGLLSR